MALSTDLVIGHKNDSRSKLFKQSELQAKADFDKSIDDAIQKMEERKRSQITPVKLAKWWELDKAASFFEKSPAYCLVHDDDYIDFTIRR